MLIPISTVFAGDTSSYIGGLTAYREEPPAIDDWIIGFSEATERAAANAVKLVEAVEELDAEIYDKLVVYRHDAGVKPEVPRRDAVILHILSILASEPVLTADSVGNRLGVSQQAAHRALTQLREAKILGRTKNHQGKLICWTADQHLGLVSMTERSNRVGGKDTRNNKPKLSPPHAT